MALPSAGDTGCTTGLSKRVYDQLVGDTTRNGFQGNTPPAAWQDMVKAICYAVAKGVADEIAAGSEAWRYVGGAGEPAFVSPWANNGGGEPGTRFKKDAAGNVWVQVCAFGGALNSTIFSLPAGYRPSGFLHYKGTSGVADCLFTVDTVGAIKPIAVAPGGNGYVRVHLLFPADQ